MGNVKRAQVLEFVSELSAIHIKANGRRINKGVLSRRLVTNAGVQFLRDCFTNTSEAENINFHDSGTSNTAENVADTTITAAGPARVSGTQSTPASNQYRTVATISYTSTLAIVEHGLFTA